MYLLVNRDQEWRRNEALMRRWVTLLHLGSFGEVQMGEEEGPEPRLTGDT